MTREYVRGIIDTLSDEQFNKIVIILEQENLPQENGEVERPKKVLTSMGSLNKYANPEMIPFEREAFENAVVESYLEKYERCKNGLESHIVKEHLERILKK